MKLTAFVAQNKRAISKEIQPLPAKVRAAIESTVDNLTFRILELETELDRTQKELNQQYILNNQDFADFTSKIVGVVNSPLAYYKASSMYGAEWFQTLPYSIEQKIELAKILIQVVSLYNKSYISTLWLNIANRNPDTLDSIRNIAE